MAFELYIDNGSGTLQKPAVIDGVRLEQRRIGAPSRLTFSVVNDGTLNFLEGNPVRLAVDGNKMFFGFIFKKRRGKDGTIDVTAYDQMRYLKNKDTYQYANKTASDVIRMVAADFQLRLGHIANTSYIIPRREESNSTLFDIIYTALDLDLTNTGNMYIFYDDFGELTLRPLDDMKINLLLDEETGQNFDYTSSIADKTYNRIKLSFENSESGRRDIYIAQSGENINRWGVLQYYGTLEEGENGAEKVNALLDLFNAKTRRLRINDAFGDPRVRAGALPVVSLNLGDIIVQSRLLVEKCVHRLRESEHLMDLVLRGGEING